MILGNFKTPYWQKGQKDMMTVYIGNFLNARGEIDETITESKLGYDVKIVQARKSFFYRYRDTKENGGLAWRIEKVEIPKKVKASHISPKIIEVHMCYATVLLKNFDLEECRRFYEGCKKARG